MTSEIAKETWVEEYSRRIFKIWQGWQGPLGVSEQYIEHLKDELCKQYDDPLKRSMIEMNYPGNGE